MGPYRTRLAYRCSGVAAAPPADGVFLDEPGEARSGKLNSEEGLSKVAAEVSSAPGVARAVPGEAAEVLSAPATAPRLASSSARRRSISWRRRARSWRSATSICWR